MAGFRVDMSPLETSSMNVGRSLVNVGQSVGQSIQRSQQQQQAREEQAQAEALMQQALTGNPESLQQLMVKSPQAAQMVAQYLQQQTAQAQGESDRLKSQMAMDTADFVEQMHLAPQEQQEAMFNSAIDDPRYDIDEEDRQYFMNPNARKALITQVKSKEYADNFFGVDDKEVKTETIQTPTGIKVIDKTTGETVRDVVVPEKQKEFKAKQEERLRKSKEAAAKEKSRIAKEKIEVADRKEAVKSSIATSANTFKLASDLLKGDQIENITGKFDRLGTMIGLQGGEEADVMNKANQLKDLLTLDNLKLMSGVLTDRDIKVLASAASGLNLDDYGFVGSTEGVKGQIKKIMSSLDQKLKAAVKRGDLSQLDYENIKNPKEDELSDEDLLSKYGG